MHINLFRRSFKSDMNTAQRSRTALGERISPFSLPPPATSEGLALSASGRARGRRRHRRGRSGWDSPARRQGACDSFRGGGSGGGCPTPMTRCRREVAATACLKLWVSLQRAFKGVEGSLLTLKPGFSPRCGLTYSSQQHSGRLGANVLELRELRKGRVDCKPENGLSLI